MVYKSELRDSLQDSDLSAISKAGLSRPSELLFSHFSISLCSQGSTDFAAFPDRYYDQCRPSMFLGYYQEQSLRYLYIQSLFVLRFLLHRK